MTTSIFPHVSLRFHPGYFNKQSYLALPSTVCQHLIAKCEKVHHAFFGYLWGEQTDLPGRLFHVVSWYVFPYQTWSSPYRPWVVLEVTAMSCTIPAPWFSSTSWRCGTGTKRLVLLIALSYLRLVGGWCDLMMVHVFIFRIGEPNLVKKRVDEGEFSCFLRVLAVCLQGNRSAFHLDFSKRIHFVWPEASV